MRTIRQVVSRHPRQQKVAFVFPDQLWEEPLNETPEQPEDDLSALWVARPQGTLCPARTMNPDDPISFPASDRLHSTSPSPNVEDQRAGKS